MKPLYDLPSLLNLKISQVLKYKGSITLLMVNMSRMAAELIETQASQFGRKDKDFGNKEYESVEKFLDYTHDGRENNFCFIGSRLSCCPIWGNSGQWDSKGDF